jgi:hypothetical protein
MTPNTEKHEQVDSKGSFNCIEMHGGSSSSRVGCLAVSLGYRDAALPAEVPPSADVSSGQGRGSQLPAPNSQSFKNLSTLYSSSHRSTIISVTSLPRVRDIATTADYQITYLPTGFTVSLLCSISTEALGLVTLQETNRKLLTR